MQTNRNGFTPLEKTPTPKRWSSLQSRWWFNTSVAPLDSKHLTGSTHTALPLGNAVSNGVKERRSLMGFTKFIVLVFILIVILLMISYSKNRSKSSSSLQNYSKKVRVEESLKDLPLTEKTKRAEAYLSQLRKDIDHFFMSFEKANPSPQKIKQDMKQYNTIINNYTSRINALQLICRSSNRSYINWTKDFQARDRKVMDGANKKTQEILKKAGFTPH